MRSATKKLTGKDREYLTFLHGLACEVCARQGIQQATPTEAAHVGAHGMSQKCPDNEAIPLCRQHHREGSEAQHVLGRRFWQRHGINKVKLIRLLQARYRAWKEDPYAEAC